MTQDGELVEDDACLWRISCARMAKGLPPVHRSQLDARRLLRAQRGKEAIEVRFGAAFVAHPDWPPAVAVTDDDPVVMARPDGELVHANRPRRGQAGTGHLLLHVDCVEGLDGAVVDPLRLGNRRVGHLAAARAHMHREALSETRVRRQPVQACDKHAVTPRASDPPAFELDVETKPTSREVARSAGALVIPAATTVPTL